MPSNPKGCGKPLNFTGIITEEERQFLMYCCKAVNLLWKDKRKLAGVKKRAIRKNNQALHIISIVEKIERVHDIC
jgi:hypothetical protein